MKHCVVGRALSLTNVVCIIRTDEERLGSEEALADDSNRLRAAPRDYGDELLELLYVSRRNPRCTVKVASRNSPSAQKCEAKLKLLD